MVIASLFRNAKVAAGFGSALFFVLLFFAGLWIQRPLMPDWMRHISDFTPSGAAVAGAHRLRRRPLATGAAPDRAGGVGGGHVVHRDPEVQLGMIGLRGLPAAKGATA